MFNPNSMIAKTYQERFKRRNLFLIPLLLAIAAMLSLALAPPTVLLALAPHMGSLKIAVGVFVVAYPMATFRGWRCPQCHHSLGKAFNPKFCPDCGVQFHA